MAEARTSTHPRIDRPPAFVRFADRLGRGLLRAGMPMGPNTLLTVRGRQSGVPRSAGVALIEVKGRRWVNSVYGETHWVHNLRAAGTGTIRVGRREVPVDAVELSLADKVAFYREVLTPFVRGQLTLRLMGRVFVGDILADPEGAAIRHPVFELIERPG
jgi:deazaflavin-dependent oxidoreductase (nitroreductase family)